MHPMYSQCEYICTRTRVAESYLDIPRSGRKAPKNCHIPHISPYSIRNNAFLCAKRPKIDTFCVGDSHSGDWHADDCHAGDCHVA